MSFDLHCQRFRNGSLVEMPTEQLVAHFAPHIARREAWGMRLLYPDGGGGDLYIEGDSFDSFMINRSAGAMLFDDLFALMQKAGLVLYWPSETPSLIVADSDLIAEVMIDVVEACGPARLVSCGRDIVEAIEQGWPPLRGYS